MSRKVFLVTALLLVVAWPAIVFRDHVAFDPVAFTEEWTKIILSGFVLVIALQYVSERRQAEHELDKVRLMIKTLVEEHAGQILAVVEEVENSDSDYNLNLPLTLEQVGEFWRPLSDGIGTCKNLILLANGTYEAELSVLVNFDLLRCETLFQECLRGSISSSELRELHRKLSNLVASLEAERLK